ncbi:putative phosphatidate phosphatase [Calliphora vicina]|uniref:putative phosphatidate phosphatase n=1 Tax=Calliphora vicina TaxID=7373 RepID=UPI00325A7308
MCSNPNTRLLMRLVIDVLLLTSVYCVALVILPQIMKTQQRGFFCGDETLLYPYKSETLLKRLHITILVIAIPAALILCIEMLRVAFPANKTTSTATSLVPKSPQQYVFVGVRVPTFVSECYNTMGVYLFGLALVLIVTTVTKGFTGRLAPYFYEVCQPIINSNETACTANEHFGSYIENYTCGSLTSSTHLLTVMRQSFPSAHASTTAYAMLFLTIYFQARLQTGWLQLWRTLLQITCMMVSLLVSFERLISYRHHWTDVLAGLIIGYSMAAFMTHLVSQFFKKVPVKVRRIREDASNIYGYYTVMPRPRYY